MPASDRSDHQNPHKLPIKVSKIRLNSVLTFQVPQSTNKSGPRLKITVTICAFCKSEAEFAIDGVPLCEMCSGRPEGEIGRLQTDQRIRADLQRKMLASTARAHAASEKLIAIMGDIPSGLPQPDDSLRIQNAARALSAARNEMMNAHSRLNEFLARGVAPGGFEPGGPA